MARESRDITPRASHMVIVDTTVWVDYLRGIANPETDWLDAELERQRLGVTDLIVCEVLQGFVMRRSRRTLSGNCSSWRCSQLAASTLRERPLETIARCEGEARRSAGPSTASSQRSAFGKGIRCSTEIETSIRSKDFLSFRSLMSELRTVVTENSIWLDFDIERWSRGFEVV